MLTIITDRLAKMGVPLMVPSPRALAAAIDGLDPPVFLVVRPGTTLLVTTNLIICCHIGTALVEFCSPNRLINIRTVSMEFCAANRFMGTDTTSCVGGP